MTIGNQLLTIPQHIAIIMDGNRRWAREHGLPVLSGHKKVTDDILEPLIEHAADLGVKYLTFWAWSTENWQRNEREVTGIMRLFRHVIRDRWDRLHKKGVKIQTIGDISKFPDDIYQSLLDVIEKTKDNRRITAVFALNYGGRDEIIRAFNKYITNSVDYNLDRLNVILASELSSASRIDSGVADAPQNDNRNKQLIINNCQLTSEKYQTYLDTCGIPDPELIVRPGGEQRLSGFLLWQSNYSELYFPKWYMPEFSPQKLDEAISEFISRKRRFGK